MHYAIVIQAKSEKGKQALKKQYSNYKKSDKREKMLGRGMGVSTEFQEEEPLTVKVHFRGMAAKLVRREHGVLEVHTHMKEADCIDGEDYKIEVED